jgi:hypothetical protein
MSASTNADLPVWSDPILSERNLENPEFHIWPLTVKDALAFGTCHLDIGPDGCISKNLARKLGWRQTAFSPWSGGGRRIGYLARWSGPGNRLLVVLEKDEWEAPVLLDTVLNVEL